MKENSYKFKWQDIGNIEIGRPNLGRNTDVAVYRLMQYTMRSVLNNELDGEKASEMFYKSGFLAGSEFCANLLDTSLDIHAFIANLQEQLKALGIGILRIEEADIQNHKFTLTVAEDLDCSGLPITNETVCEYDEGFISGILTHYTGLDFIAKEIDCWSTGDRVCRFKVGLKDGKK